MATRDALASAADPDAVELAREVVSAGLVEREVLDHLNSLHPQVPNSMKLRYLVNLLYQKCKCEQFFFQVVKVLAAIQPISAHSSTCADISFSTADIAELAELLVPYSYKWRSIGTGLKFTPQDLNNMAACPSLLPDGPKSFMLRIVEDWVQQTFEYTSPPSMIELDSVLRSDLVNLGKVAHKLRTNTPLNRQQNHNLPYFVENLVVTYEQDTADINYIDSDDGTDDGTQYSGDSIYSDKKHIHVESTCRNINNRSKLEAEEHGSVLRT
jgi:hypothetical protein